MPINISLAYRSDYSMQFAVVGICCYFCTYESVLLSQHIKGIISDSLGLRKIFKTLQNQRKIYDNHNMYHFSQKKSHKFDRKTDFHQISFRGVSLNGKISLNFRIKFCVSLSIKHIRFGGTRNSETSLNSHTRI